MEANVSIEEKRRIVAILFSDIKGYSAINNDDLYTKVKAFNEEFKR
jgi:class 3 adenylate cyclase